LPDALVYYYLYNVRDFKIDSETLRVGVVRIIGIADINAYPVEKFLSEVQHKLGGPTGRLAVSSRPDNAPIRLDGKENGRTDKVSIEAAGHHEIGVVGSGLHCKGNVYIPTGGTATFKCP
jgi:hypothetical protein